MNSFSITELCSRVYRIRLSSKNVGYISYRQLCSLLKPRLEKRGGTSSHIRNGSLFLSLSSFFNFLITNLKNLNSSPLSSLWMDRQKKSRHSNPFKINRRNSLLPTRDESRYRIRIRARTRLCVTIVGWPITRTDRESAATRSFLDKKLMEIYVTRQDVLQPLERIIEFAAGRRESPWTIFLSLSLSTTKRCYG